MTNPHCICEEPGMCPRHQMKKVGRFFKFCKGIAPTDDCGLKYWIGFERGKFGATAPEDPILEPDWECDGRNLTPVPASIYVPQLAGRPREKPLPIKSQIGTILSKIFIREYGTIPCGKCKRVITILNNKTIEEIERDRESIIEDIASRAKSVAPNWWVKFQVIVDKQLHLGQTYKRLQKHLTEAIEREKEQT